MKVIPLKFPVVGRFLSAVMIAFLSAFTVFAQSNASDLNGTVTDPNGAVVAGATVTARNPATGLTRTVTAND
ncbi:MAG TPA: carboxypeptidase-like regulatory domain-containing protein, partial [Pyrinomonadaceae bacterium]